MFFVRILELWKSKQFSGEKKTAWREKETIEANESSFKWFKVCFATLIAIVVVEFASLSGYECYCIVAFDGSSSCCAILTIKDIFLIGHICFIIITHL